MRTISAEEERMLAAAYFVHGYLGAHIDSGFKLPTDRTIETAFNKLNDAVKIASPELAR